MNRGTTNRPLSPGATRMTDAHRPRRAGLALVAGLLIAMIGGTAHAATVAHWTFDGGTVGDSLTSDTDIANSITVDQFDGNAINPGDDVEYIAGPSGFGTAANFDNATNGNDGEGSALSSADGLTSSLVGLSALTIEAFVFVETDTTLSGANNIFRKSDQSYDGISGDLDDGYTLVLVDGQLQIRLGRGGQDPNATDDFAAVRADSAITKGEWVHVAGTWDGSTGDMKLFVDYTEVAASQVGSLPTSLTGTLSGASNDGPASIGALVRSPGGPAVGAEGQFFDGSIDEVRISDEALSPSAFIPEPATVGLLAVGGVVMLARRRRN